MTKICTKSSWKILTCTYVFAMTVLCCSHMRWNILCSMPHCESPCITLTTLSSGQMEDPLQKFSWMVMPKICHVIELWKCFFSKIDCNEFIEYWISQSRNFEILCLNLRWLIRFWYTLCNFLNSSWFCTHCALVMFFISAFCYNVTQDNWKNVYFIYDVTWINRV